MSKELEMKKLKDLTIEELVTICEKRSNSIKLGCLGCPCMPICDYYPLHLKKDWLERKIDILEIKREKQ